MNRSTSTRRAPRSHSEGAPAPAAGGEGPPARAANDLGENNPFPDLFAGERRRSFAVLVAAGLGQGGLLAGMALLMKSGLDRAFAGADAPASASAILLFAALSLGAALAGGLKWLAHVEAERFGHSYAHALRMRLLRKVVAAGAPPKARRAAVLLRVSGDVTPLRLWVSRGLSQLIVGGLTITLAIAGLALIDWTIAAAVGVTLAAASIAALSLTRRLGDKTAETRRRRGQFANAADRSISAAQEPKSAHSLRDERRRLRRVSRRVRDAHLDRAAYTGALRAIAESGGALAGVAAMAVGAGLTAGGSLSPGSVMSAVFLAGVLAPHAQAVSRSLEYWTAAVVARRKQRELFDGLTVSSDD